MSHPIRRAAAGLVAALLAVVGLIRFGLDPIRWTV